jgi:hypothetical protein
MKSAAIAALIGSTSAGKIALHKKDLTKDMITGQYHAV